MTTINTGSRWLAARVAGLLCVAIAAPWFYKELHSEFEAEPLSWPFVVVILLAAGASVLFAMSIQRVNPIAAKSWSRPSWKSSFADSNQPLQSFHFGGWILVSLGISIGIYTAAAGFSNLMFVLPLTMGIGVLAGVRLAVLVFHERFAN